MALKPLKAITFLIFLSACSGREPEKFELRSEGYYYRLIAFSQEAKKTPTGDLLLVRASFVTQNDSVFWDSYNNLRDQFVIEADSNDRGIIVRQLSTHLEGDSFCVGLTVSDFMQEVYHTNDRPFFLMGDSVVKIYMGVAKVLKPGTELPGWKNPRLAEYKQIEQYLGGPDKYEAARDSSGFFWLEKPKLSPLTHIQEGQHIKVHIKGFFLSGRNFDQSEIHQEFDYGTPDQVVLGINNVIAQLSLGQTAKIILPSRLAFGEFGSSNGAVPPFTPLIFEIGIEAE